MKNGYQKAAFCGGVLLLLMVIVWALQVDPVYARPQIWGGASSLHGGSPVYDPSPFQANPFLVRALQHGLAAIIGALVGVLLGFWAKSIIQWFLVLNALLFLFVGIYFDRVLGNIIFFGLGAVVAYGIIKMLRSRQAPPKPTTFGSATWASLDHLLQHGLVGQDGFSLGFFEEKTFRKGAPKNKKDLMRTIKDFLQNKPPQPTIIDYPLHYTGKRHLLTVAPTRAGKGVSTIIPNLLMYQGSALVIDPKGENAMITAPRRGKGDGRGIQGLGQTVHVVDPWGISRLPASCFNPLDWLRPEDPDISENAMILADAIVSPQSKSNDSFWDEEAKALLMGLLLWVALDDDEQDNRTLGRVRDIINMNKKDMDNLLLRMEEHPNRIIYGSASRTLAKEEKLRSNVLASLQSHTHFLDSPSIRYSLSVSDFRFEDLKTSKMTIYLVLPADRMNTFGRWLRLLVQQALTVNARNIEQKPEKPVLFLLDEMASLGRLSMVEQAFGLMAGFGVQLWGIVQDLSQLYRIYGDGWQTFIGNSGVIQYFGSRDLMTAEYFSKLCGVTTVEKKSLSQAIAKAFSSGGGSNSSTSTTRTETVNDDIVQRSLIYPDELMVMRDNKQLVFVESYNPIPAKKRPWHHDEELKRHGVNLHARQTASPAGGGWTRGMNGQQERQAA